MDDGDSTRALVERFYARVWNAWDDTALEVVLADDFTFRGSLGDEERGRDAFRAYRDRLRAAVPDFHTEIIDLVCAGGHAAVRLQCRGTHTGGALLGMAASGHAFGYAAAAFLAAREGRLRSAWVLGDLDSLRRQLGG